MLASFAAWCLLGPQDVDFQARAKDWRHGAVVYQVFPDRFAPPADPAAVQAKLKRPQIFRDWEERPTAGRLLPDEGVYSHELEFWGGDLAGVASRLSYVKDVGADVLYLTPVFSAWTNHRYDSQDYRQIDPILGSQRAFDQLVTLSKTKGLKIVLDGVFNHMGKTASRFKDANSNPNSPYRNWFVFGDEFPDGYRAWFGVKNLPELNIEDPGVRHELWSGPNSVVPFWLKRGADGWRLDVAIELGPKYLGEIRKASHRAKPGSAVIGEISGYPNGWFDCLDGVFNFTPCRLVERSLNARITGGRVGKLFDQIVKDAGIENLLKTWLLVDNHDTPRLATTVPDPADRRIVQAVQFTYPGSPVVYYGSELGMTGDGDPSNRGPMRWDLATNENLDLAWIKKLTRWRKEFPSLRYGDFLTVETERLIAYSRQTEKLRESVIIVINPTNETVQETFATRLGRVLSWGEVRDLVTGESLRSVNGLLDVELPPKSVRLYFPVTDPINGATPYKRVP
ncbi:MAG: glycoside hydrolase family 13 protein [Fimbriimonadaceae bacterium]|nr:glycoside hydrolase family 13 protein [Fimbriimonadaceae bacterium]QYK58686.1 MAG: glycoside hydrolase family 13 protein [Fimbriimonadaceae bacterium]